jgi:uncharacterized protein (TIGR00251 family)
MSVWYKRENDTVIINIYLQPGAKYTKIIGFYGDALKIRLASPPIDGRANHALLNFVAQLFDVSRCQVILIKGGKSRHKKVSITSSKIEPYLLLNMMNNKLFHRIDKRD